MNYNWEIAPYGAVPLRFGVPQGIFNDDSDDESPNVANVAQMQANMMLPANFFKGGAPSLPKDGKVTRYYPDSGKGPRKQEIVMRNGQVVYGEVTEYGASGSNAQRQIIRRFK